VPIQPLAPQARRLQAALELLGHPTLRARRMRSIRRGITCVLLYNIGKSSLDLLHMVWFPILLAYVGLNEMALRERWI
jgi:hypothetical protein